MVVYQRSDIVEYPKVVVFGDSIVQYSSRPGGFASLFAEKYERKIDFVVRGFEGYNSDHYPVIIPGVFRGLGPGPIDAVVVFIGTNDATIKSSFQHVPLQRTVENATQVIDLLEGFTKHVIIVPPAYCEDSERDDRRDDDFAEYARRLRVSIKNIASQRPALTIHLVDAREALANKEKKQWHDKVPKYDPDALLDDGLHLTPFGNRKIFEAIDAKLAEISANWHQKLASLEAFMHLSVADQKALLKGHVAIETELESGY